MIKVMKEHEGRIASKTLLKSYYHKLKPGVPGFKESREKFQKLVAEVCMRVDDGGNAYYVLQDN